MKKLLLAASMAAMATAAHAVELTVWAIPNFTPSAGLPAIAEVYQDIYDTFQAENPDITLKYEVLSGGTESLQQLLTAANADNLPDLAVLDGFWIPRLVETGKLQPLNDVWTEEARSAFYQEAVDAMTFDGQVYAAWMYNAWRGLYYRIDMLEELGYDQPPSDWDEFLEFGEAAKEAGMQAVMLPGSTGELTTLHMLPMFWGLGGKLVDDEGAPVFFEGENRAALEQVYGLYRELVEKGLMSADVQTMNEAATRPFFYTGESASTAQSSSAVTQMYADSPELQGNLGAFNYPLPGGVDAKPVLVGWTYGIFADEDERKQAAWKFIEYVLAPENLGRLNVAAGHLPIVEEIWEQDFFRNDPLMQQFKAIFDAGGMAPRPPVAIYPALSTALSQQMSEVLTGAITPAEAVDRARDQTMEEYNRLTAR